MKKILTIISLLSAILLSACGADNSVQEGTKKMIKITEDLSTAINQNDQDQMKKLGPKLEDEWSKFEEEVKKSNNDLYESIEKYLDPTIAGTEAAEIKKEALTKLNDHLSTELKKLEK